jgi:hypothetical protein
MAHGEEARRGLARESAARRLAEQAAIADKDLPEVPAIDGPTRMLGPGEESKGAEG